MRAETARRIGRHYAYREVIKHIKKQAKKGFSSTVLSFVDDYSRKRLEKNGFVVTFNTITATFWIGWGQEETK